MSDTKHPAIVASSPQTHLAARVGLFDATMVVMGGIIGSGIFINPYVVAKLVHTPALIVGAWVAGGGLALIGAFIYAELAARMPEVGGQYAYIREAYHPLLGFLFGWAELFVIGAGGSAAVVVTFARYFRELTQIPAPEKVIGSLAVVVLILINCLGVRAGSGVQSFFMVLRIVGVALLVACGGWFVWRHGAPGVSWHPILDRPASFSLVTVFGATMVPILFAYGGWQTSNFIASEIRDPQKNLPRALLLGVVGVIALYVSVNFIYVETLTPAGLAATGTPASSVMLRSLGELGELAIAIAITVSTIGFLSQCMLTFPRVYFAMGEDRVLPRGIARLGRRSRAPVAAIGLQGAVIIAVVVLGTFEQILSYVVVMDWLFFGLTASCIFVFRAREKRAKSASDPESRGYRVPGHPWTTTAFMTAAWLVVLNTIYKYPRNSGVALCILLLGIPVYIAIQRFAR
ncbi:MAG TPA: amino acid permease [Candidatus Acidoferrum sp.]|nr:amino acid permease [Candidatus Acidoferrum sp.]